MWSRVPRDYPPSQRRYPREGRVGWEYFGAYHVSGLGLGEVWSMGGDAVTVIWWAGVGRGGYFGWSGRDEHTAMAG